MESTYVCVNMYYRYIIYMVEISSTMLDVDMTWKYVYKYMGYMCSTSIWNIRVIICISRIWR